MWVLEIELGLRIFNKLIAEVETTVMLIFSGLLNFSCGGGWVLKLKLKPLKLSTKLKLKLKLKFGKNINRLKVVKIGLK